ncbi:MAG: hypothetical protein M1339_00915 [Bacteroidetes bacterium]|nr:hypothetical protein [Bacteroidota bacterium]
MKRISYFAVQFAVIMFAASIAVAAGKSHGVSEKFQKSFTLSPGGTVSLENVNGNLKVTTWDKNEVRVEAVKYADDKESLDGLAIDVDATSDAVDIHTHYPEDENHSRGHGTGVNYVLTVPKSANLDKINIVNGGIDISGVNGKVIMSTVNGAVRARGLGNICELKVVNGGVDAGFAALPVRADVELKAVNGSLVLRLPANAKADIRAKAAVGRISDDFGLHESSESGGDALVKIGESLRGEIGGGGASIKLETVNGSIEILKSKANR